jgi:hypothetical protein
LLREEMRRVIRYLDWETTTWQVLAEERVPLDDLSAPTELGKAAYAAKQAATCRELADFYKRELSKSVGATVDSVLSPPQEDIGAELNDLFALGTFLSLL